MRILTLLTAALLIGGCRYDDIDTRWGLDFDEDGADFAADCDDEDPDRYPGAEDIPDDGTDQDCDGVDSTVCFTDADGDGYGVDTTVVSDSGDCDPQDGHADVQGDCADADASVYPGASELCDGQLNDCDGTMLATEVDADGDSYAECTLDSGGWDGAGTVVGGDDCDDDDPNTYPGASEICDGLVNACGGTLEDCNDDDIEVYPGAGELCDGLVTSCGSLQDDEIDDDDDGYVDCEFAPGITEENWGNTEATPIVGDDDCDDNDVNTYPSASEICDGLVNNCGGDLPANEIDGDDDRYVECTFAGGVDANNWGNTEDPTVIGGQDCDPSDPDFYPGAPEICDGYANGCGVLPANEIDNDDDGYVECTFAGGVNSGNWGNTESPPVTGDADCNDSSSDIYPGAPELCDGLVFSCGSLPADEIDNDDDGYVDCEFEPGVTANNWGNTESPPVVGDDDCDDVDPDTNPGASEICDGLDNDCGGDLPANEIDGDDDQYVGCTFAGGVDAGNWGNVEDPVILGDQDCEPSDPDYYPGAPEICEGFATSCGALPADEVDNDDDGYVECTFAEAVNAGNWGNTESPPVIDDEDCDDAEPRTYPSATEWCDGEDNDCDEVEDDPDAEGVASFEAVGDVWSDVTETIKAGSHTFTTAGTLHLCPDTYHATLHLQADVDIVGQYGKGRTKLDGKDSIQLISIESGASNVSIDGMEVKKGVAANGGALTCALTGASAPTVTITNSTFKESNATVDGGAIYLADGVLSISDSKLHKNEASDDGGAIFMPTGQITLSEVDVDENKAADNGGGIYLVNGDIDVTGGRFHKNVAEGGSGEGGGGIAIEIGSITAVGTDFTENDAKNNDGGAIYVDDTFNQVAVTIDLDDCLFTKNKADDWGGAIACHDPCDIIAVDTLFHLNEADDGGAILLRPGTFECTATDTGLAGVYDNTANAAGNGGGVKLQSSPSLVDSLACDWGTGDFTNVEEDLAGTGWTMDYGDNETFCCTDAACPDTCP
jgi:hypothetical protein